MVKRYLEKLRQMNKKNLFWILLPLLILGAIALTLYLLFGRRLLVVVEQPEVFKAWLDGLGPWGEVAFTAIRAAQTVFKFVPAEPLEVASGYAFGVWGGLLWCMVGTELGSAIIILLTKKFGMRFVSKFIDPEKLKSFSFLQDNRKLRPLLFVIYFIPGAPKDLLTYFLAFTDLKISEYLIITSVARIPSIITSTMCGAYFGNKNYLAAVLVYAVTLLISLLGVLVYRKIEKHESKPENEEK